MHVKVRWKWWFSLSVCVGLSLVWFSLSPAVQAQSVQSGSPQSPFHVKVFVITMFGIEAQQWNQHEYFTRTFHVAGADNPVQCTQKGLCITITGVDKVNAATSMTAILLDPQFSFAGCYFLTAGTASTSPERGTLGFGAWARWVVDWDQGLHLLPGADPDLPYGYSAPSTSYSDSTAVYQLNEPLVQLAYQLTSHLYLRDSTAARQQRLPYPSQSGQMPHVALCDTLAGDNIWVGHGFSNEAQYITDKLTNYAGTNCTYEQEDTAVATVLKRLGYLDHYLDLRVASAFDQPYPHQSVHDFLKAHFRANDIATINLYLIGSVVAHYLLQAKDLHFNR